MEKFVEKNNILKIFLLVICEIICFGITDFFIIDYDMLYFKAMLILQLLHLLPTLLIALPANPTKKLLTISTFLLIIYSVILHFFIDEIISVFVKARGLINFVEYASKIYFICFPLVGFRILWAKHENLHDAFLGDISRILLLTFISILFNDLFFIKGVLYAVPLSEVIIFIILIHKKAET